MGAGCYDFIGKGFDSLVTTADFVSLNETPCVSCGRCAETCPVGALMPRPRILETYQLDVSRCIFCGSARTPACADALRRSRIRVQRVPARPADARHPRDERPRASHSLDRRGGGVDGHPDPPAARASPARRGARPPSLFSAPSAPFERGSRIQICDLTIRFGCLPCRSFGDEFGTGHQSHLVITSNVAATEEKPMTEDLSLPLVRRQGRGGRFEFYTGLFRDSHIDKILAVSGRHAQRSGRNGPDSPFHR